MGLFAKEAVVLDPAVISVAIGSSPSDHKRFGKIQAELLAAMGSGERLVAVAADGQNWGSAVMAVTNQRILYGTGSHIEYIIEGSRVAKTTIKRKETGNNREPFRFCTVVTWVGNALKHQRIKNYYLTNDFLAIWRSDYDLVNELCGRIDSTFGLQ